jgi:RimJ/RimL family protein N-acetyltransferase
MNSGGLTPEPKEWLPPNFVAPHRVDIDESTIHLRPIHPDDTEIDMIAVMGSRDRLWSIYGEAWGWPPVDMTAAADREDLARHAAEMSRNESFNYALFDERETALLGCVYIDPPERVGADAEISWWVVDEHVGGPVERALDEFVPNWIATVWPFDAPRFVGRDITWAQWLDLEEI